MTPVPPTAEAKQARPRRPLLLAIEDEVPIVELLETLVEPLGVEVVAAGDGRQALSMLETLRPTLITLDLVLPDVDGFQVLEQVRRRGSLDEVPVVVLTALCDPQTMKRAYTMGASDFIGKPFNVHIVEAKLRLYLHMVRLAEEVRERERFLEEVMEQISSGLIVLDAAGRVRRLNAAGAAALGLPDALSAVGRPLAEIAPGAEALWQSPGTQQQRVRLATPSIGAAGVAAEGTGAGGMVGGTWGAGGTGPERALGFSNARLNDGGVVAIFRELSASETARREAEERARHEALSRAARSFAHEVRNPLAAIAAAAQVIGRDDADVNVRKRLSRAVESEALRVAGLVREYVERQTPLPANADVELPLLLEEIVEVNLLDNPARDRVRVACAPGLPRVRADASRLKQVVLNLLLNAITATEQGGVITVAAAAEGEGVKLMVRDTGSGIPAAVLPRIFEENFTTRPGGNGLGLPLSKRIVEEHGGSLRVESAPGRGTAFTVWLRASESL